MRLVLSGNPVPASRPRISNGHAYYTASYEAVRKVWKLEAAAGAPRMYGRSARLAVAVTFYRETRYRADADNLAKGVMDALSGAWYADDDQVDELHVYVVRGVGKGRGRTVVRVARVGRVLRAPGLRAQLRAAHRIELARAARERDDGTATDVRRGRAGAGGDLRDVPLPGGRRTRRAGVAAA
jgi:Holliday junction resolvase RusA-like endonuclease